MFSRRVFLKNLFASCGVVAASQLFAAAESPLVFKGKAIFDRILEKSDRDKWSTLPIGQLMGKIALELQGTPYVAGTLEVFPDKEVCSVDLTGMDCVTFFETTLDFARMLKGGGRTPEDLLREIGLTRYRGGMPGDYSTRLHYTKDWFLDNENKHVVEILSDLPGSAPFPQRVGFMTTHPESYKALVKHPELVQALGRQETIINSHVINYIPLDKIVHIEPMLKTGDIVGVCTSTPGIDIIHTGLVYRDEAGVPHFMDASSKKNVMHVTIESGPISKALSWSKTLTGAIFARPLEIGK